MWKYIKIKFKDVNIEFNVSWVENHLRVSSSEDLNMPLNANTCPDNSDNLQRAESKFAIRFFLWQLQAQQNLQASVYINVRASWNIN